MELNPVFVNELRQSPLRRKPLQGFLLWVGLTILLMWLSQFSARGICAVGCAAGGPAAGCTTFAAGTFAKEYEQQTWQELTLTRLTNLQVVLGKFGAALMLSLGTAMSLLPSMILMQMQQMPWLRIEFWTLLAALWKLALSASLYVMLAMTCSRYSSNRRTALVWSYVALSLYALIGAAIWTTMGQTVDRNTAYLANNGYANSGYNNAPQTMTDLVAPGFMGGIHLIFCSVVGLGTLFLIWVSLSEQRGYRADASSDSPRSWQPLPRP